MILEIILILFTIFLVRKAFFSGNESVNLPPGPKRLPFLGSLIEFAKYYKGNLAPYKLLAKLSKVYGPIMYLQLGQISQVVVEDLELTKKLLSDDLWVKRFFDNYLGERSFGKPLGIAIVSGEGWKEMRRFTLRTLRDFGFGKQKSMDMIFEEEIGDFRANFEKRIQDGGGVVSMNKTFTITVLNILWSMVSGKRFLYDDARLQELVSLLDKVMKSNQIAANIYQIFPFLWYIIPPITKARRNRIALRKKIYGFFNDVILDRKELGTYKEEQRDFIDVFLKEIDHHKENNSKLSDIYTHEQFLVVCYDLFATGSETTSNTLEFAVLYMILNPEVQNRVREEIDRVIGRSRCPSPLDKSSMPYTEATILEVHRISNVIPMNVRSPTETTKIGQWDVPKGTVGIFNLHAIHMSKETWGDPEVFRPERFLDDSRKVINASKILPFGCGKRVCLGEPLAKHTLFTYFTTLLQNYIFEAVPGKPKLTTEATLSLTLSPMPFEALIKLR